MQLLPDSVITNNQKETIEIHAYIEEYLDIPPPPLPPIFEIPERVKQQRQPRTTPARGITIEILDTIPTLAQIYYYSPRMESKDYSYRKELGSDNNFLEATDIDNRGKIYIPDTCEQGAKLMFRAEGYKPLDMPMNSICDKSHITVKLMPKVYQSTVALKETKVKIGQDSVSKITLKVLNETPTKVFYGECLPIYFDDYGINHSDPICASGGMGCYPEFDLYDYNFFKYIGNDELMELFQSLQEGEKCCFLISIDKRRIQNVEIEKFPNKTLEKFRQFMLTEQWKINHNGYRFQYRVCFITQYVDKVKLK
jgi:hypothetical protein